MEVKSEIERLRFQCEKAFYVLSKHVDKETAELLAPVIVGVILETQKEVYNSGLKNCNIADDKAKEAEKELNSVWSEEEYGSYYSDGMRMVTNARRRAYTQNIEDIDNSLEILKLI